MEGVAPSVTRQKINVQDGGYVRLVSYHSWNMVGLRDAILAGDLSLAQSIIQSEDLSAVNAARTSFAKEKEVLSPADYRLLKFLAEAKPRPHSSPFRHTHVTLEVNAPLAICRQWWRHIIGAPTTEDGTPWSEMSRRYVRGQIEIHTPRLFRKAAENAKQGSAGPLGVAENDQALILWMRAVQTAEQTYHTLIELGVAPEQARMLLPQATYTTFRWSPSLQALAHFLVEREDEHAQQEIREYAHAVGTLCRALFPASLEALTKSPSPTSPTD